MNVRFANVNVFNWNELSVQEQKIVGEFFDKWFNKTDGLGIAPVPNNVILPKMMFSFIHFLLSRRSFIFLFLKQKWSLMYFIPRKMAQECLWSLVVLKIKE